MSATAPGARSRPRARGRATQAILVQMPGNLRPQLTAAALRELLAHAAREYPRECCGVVYGKRGSGCADRVRPSRNLQDELHAEDPARFPRDGRTGYCLDAPDLLALARSLDGEEPALIVYHSHCDVGAYFSAADHAAATHGDEPVYPVDHVVIEVDERGARRAIQFAWRQDVRRYTEAARYPAPNR